MLTKFFSHCLIFLNVADSHHSGNDPVYGQICLASYTCRLLHIEAGTLEFRLLLLHLLAQLRTCPVCQASVANSHAASAGVYSVFRPHFTCLIADLAVFLHFVTFFPECLCEVDTPLNDVIISMHLNVH